MADFYAAFSILPQYQTHCVVTEGTPDIPGNYSPLNGALYVEKLSGSGYSTSASGNLGVLNGDFGFPANGWAPYNFVSASSKLIGSGSGNVTHNPDGTRTATGAYAANDNNGGNMGSASGSWALGLTPIPRGPKVEFDGGWAQSVVFVEFDGAWVPALMYAEYNGAWELVG